VWEAEVDEIRDVCKGISEFLLGCDEPAEWAAKSQSGIAANIATLLRSNRVIQVRYE